MKPVCRLLLSAPLLLSIACGTENTAPTEASEKKSAPFKVGLLTPGAVNDGGWNQIAYEGLTLVKEKLGAEISHQETKTPAEFEEGFRYYGSQNYRLAFGHGFEFQDAALKAGKEFPGTVFITTSGSSVAPNVSPMVFELEQATYLLGMIAARESKSGIAGVVGGIELPSIASTFLAFEAGARAVNPKFEVRKVYTGNFDDLSAARLAALSLANAGADFIFHQANEAGRGVFQACTERKIRCFGSNKNQNNLAPEAILASATLDVPSAFVLMATRVRDHSFQPGVQRLGMKDRIVDLVWNDQLKPSVSPETVKAVEEARARILAGTLEVPRGF